MRGPITIHRNQQCLFHPHRLGWIGLLSRLPCCSLAAATNLHPTSRCNPSLSSQACRNSVPPHSHPAAPTKRAIPSPIWRSEEEDCKHGDGSRELLQGLSGVLLHSPSGLPHSTAALVRVAAFGVRGSSLAR